MNSERPLTVFIYEDEANLISNWTLQYPAIETGGDLFGLWRNESEVVVQVVLGPGKESRRTPTSFFQDEGYLNDVGGHLTAREGLCNIGAWHSHHRMNLPEPSRGDAETIWKHLPTPGRFVLLITSIPTREDSSDNGVMTFSLFDSAAKKRMLRMKCKILEGRSPLLANPMIKDVLLSRAEIGRPRREKRRYDKKFRERNTCEGSQSYHSQEQWSHYNCGRRRSYDAAIHGHGDPRLIHYKQAVHDDDEEEESCMIL